jgi:hypothetical protein
MRHAPAALLRVAAACACVLAFDACAKKGAPSFVHPLDRKDGFRDVHFGQSPANIRGIEAARPVYTAQEKDIYKIYRRAGEDLQVGETRLQEIRYAFFKDQLTEIHLLWDPKAHLGSALPPIFGFLTNQFGAPSSQSIDTKRREFRAVWEAQWVRLTLIEEEPRERIPGQGVVTITSKPLAQQRDAAGRAAATRPKAGF